RPSPAPADPDAGRRRGRQRSWPRPPSAAAPRCGIRAPARDGRRAPSGRKSGGRGGRGRRRLGSDTGHLVAAHGAPRRTVRNVEERAARTLHQKTPILIAPLIASPSPATYTPAARSLRRCSWLI